jgi:hypothetical protein
MGRWANDDTSHDSLSMPTGTLFFGRARVPATPDEAANAWTVIWRVTAGNEAGPRPPILPLLRARHRPFSGKGTRDVIHKPFSSSNYGAEKGLCALRWLFKKKPVCPQ